MTNDLFKPAYIKLQGCWVCRFHFWFDCTILENMLLLVVVGEYRCCFKQILKYFDLVGHFSTMRMRPPARSMTTPWNGKRRFPVGKQQFTPGKRQFPLGDNTYLNFSILFGVHIDIKCQRPWPGIRTIRNSPQDLWRWLQHWQEQYLDLYQAGVPNMCWHQE